MKSFVLILLSVFLFSPCIAQAMDEDYYSGIASSVHKYIAAYGNFGDFVVSLKEDYDLPVQVKTIPITEEQVQWFSELETVRNNQPISDFERGFYQIAKSPGFAQIRDISSDKGQVQFAPLIRDNQFVLDVANNSFGKKGGVTWDNYGYPYAIRIVADKENNHPTGEVQGMISVAPGNGGGGVFYQAGFTGLQEKILGEHSQKGIKLITYGQGLQGMEVDPYNLELTYWKAMMPNGGHIEKIWEAVYEASNTELQDMQAKQMPMITRGSSSFSSYEIVDAGYDIDMNFNDGAISAEINGDNGWSHYGTQMGAIIQAVMWAGKTDSLSDFYGIMNDHSLNGIMFVVGPGNGGGGTYIMHRK